MANPHSESQFEHNYFYSMRPPSLVVKKLQILFNFCDHFFLIGKEPANYVEVQKNMKIIQ